MTPHVRKLLATVALSNLAIAWGASQTELALADLQGRTQSLADYRSRIVVLNFWATWCVPCRAEMPVLVEVRSRYAPQGVEVIGASADTEATRVKIPAFLRRHKIDFPIWVGATTAHMKTLGLGEALPATAIIDRDGSIVARILGRIEGPEIEERLRWLLGDRTGLAPPALVTHLEKHKEDHVHGAVGLEGASTVPS